MSAGIGWQIPRLPGLGDVDWGEIFSALYRAGYDGDVIIEHEDRGFEKTDELDQARLPARPRRPPPVLASECDARSSIASLTYRDIAKTIDHSLLRPELDDAFVEDGCRLALEYDVASVCVRPVDVATAPDDPGRQDVAVGTVIGFPHGSHLTATKVVRGASGHSADGARELDMVIQIGALKSGRDADVQADIAAVVEVAHAAGAIVKVIFENAYLTDDEKVRGCASHRGGRGGLRQDLDRLRPGRRDPRGPRLMRANTFAAHPGQGRRRRPDPRRAARGHGPRRDPRRGDRDQDDPRRLPGPQGRARAGRPGRFGGRRGRRDPGRLLMTPCGTVADARALDWLAEAQQLLERLGDDAGRGDRARPVAGAPTRSRPTAWSTCSGPATRGSRSRRCSRATARTPASTRSSSCR